jgi:hypothetical protein
MHPRTDIMFVLQSLITKHDELSPAVIQARGILEEMQHEAEELDRYMDERAKIEEEMRSHIPF